MEVSTKSLHEGQKNGKLIPITGIFIIINLLIRGIFVIFAAEFKHISYG